jgi:hypothetical protein
MKPTTGIGSWMVRALLILPLVLGTAPLAAAQSPAAKEKAGAAKTNAALAKSQPATAAKPANGQREGIKVHGHWTIEVRNPDGSLASRTEFENSLMGGGQETLVRLLARQAALQTETWFIDLEGTPQPCSDAQQQPIKCTIRELSGSPPPFGAIQVEYIPYNPSPQPGSASLGPGDLKLTGGAIAARASTINLVRTLVSSTLGLLTFSEATVPITNPPTNQVVKDQVIQVTVLISFR